mmetsp:Transcript_10540/g.23361  ORF Transcript_10540/g.23361 Transcript_10540/m.23361 type:complete len:242 (-) Transcript_10540:102-827(-)|eukprot:CAMPEP_0172300816 /NCGR_PEP_ID=MMETSP1058-20130122/2828_1 /TAXON_ID=83371 /ORGANISM="Detonula confervacea, Strain CCMP 353" /LENGTH=241 /DNA_ID=CAMNT_0013010719 /DNA_START=221 /DNA_END=946 /DNA_ORIENTATION=+
MTLIHDEGDLIRKTAAAKALQEKNHHHSNTHPRLPKSFTEVKDKTDAARHGRGDTKPAVAIQNPVANWEPKDYLQLTGDATTQAKLIATNSAYFEEQITKGLSLGRREAVLFAKECFDTGNCMDKLELAVNYEDKMHNYVITDAARNVNRIKAELAEAENHEKFVRERQLMSTGKSRALISIVRKGLYYIGEAIMFDDTEDPMALDGAKEKWCNSLIEVQQHMAKGNAESIELIMKKLRDD